MGGGDWDADRLGGGVGVGRLQVFRLEAVDAEFGAGLVGLREEGFGRWGLERLERVGGVFVGQVEVEVVGLG
jgi:hypothetical protein